MLTARTLGAHRIEIVDEPTPEVGPGEVLVRVRHVALCGTDLHIWEGTFPTELPIVQGHEIAGTVEAVGPGVTGPAVGDPVAVNPSNPCGHCRPCRTGRFNCCVSMRTLGCFVLDGGLTELLGVPQAKICPLPAGLPLELAALGEPMSIAMQAVNRARPEPGETALVLGCGPIGVLATRYLTDLGVQVLAADIDPERAAAATVFGAVRTLVVNPGQFPTAEQTALAQDLSGGDGISLVIEATGVPSSTRAAIDLVGNGGRIVQVGISSLDAPVPSALLALKELDLLGSRNSLNLIPSALELLARHQDAVSTLITHRFGLTDLASAYETMRAKQGHVGKVLVNVS